MDQNITNKHKEILWDLLANPAENAHAYKTTLESLVQDNPQSGLLQVMFARTAETIDINKAAAYFNPKALHKILNDPDGLLYVSRERINSYANGKHTAEPEKYFNIGDIAETEDESAEQISDAPVAQEESLITTDLIQPANEPQIAGEFVAEHDSHPALPPHTNDFNNQPPVQDYIAPQPRDSYDETVSVNEHDPEPETPSADDSKSAITLQLAEENQPETESFSVIETPQPYTGEPATAAKASATEEESEMTEGQEPAIAATAPVINQWHQPADAQDDDEDPFYDPWDLSKLEERPHVSVFSYQQTDEDAPGVASDAATGTELQVKIIDNTIQPAAATPADEEFNIQTYDHSLSAFEQAAVIDATEEPEKKEPKDVSSFDNYRVENVFHRADYLDDEVYEEIVSIDQIGAEILGNKFAEDTTTDEDRSSGLTPSQVSAQQNYIDDETERLIYGNIAATDYLSFDKKLDELHKGNKITQAGEQPVPPTEPKSAPAEMQSVTDPQQVEKYTQESIPAAKPLSVFAAPADKEPGVISKYNDNSLPYSFMWWLDKTRNEHAGTTQPYAEPVKSETQAQYRAEFNPSAETLANKTAPDELQQQYYANIFSLTSVSSIGDTEPPKVAFDPNKKEDVIIERFIHTDPHIKPLAADKLDNENKAKKSSEDQNIMVTETLARIYADQMLYHKAIATYKKLMLKLPEKKLYFAAQIGQLEKKIN